MSTNFTGGGSGEPPEIPEIEIPPSDFKSTGKAVGQGLKESGLLEDSLSTVSEWMRERVAEILAYFLTHLVSIMGFVAELWLKIRENMEPSMAKLASVAVSDLFGTEVQSEAFARAGPRAGRQQLSHILGEQILHSIVGRYDVLGTEGVRPSEEPAAQYLAAMADLAVEGWFEKAIMGFIPGKILEDCGELKESVSDVFGFGRLTRRVLGPYIKILIEDPTTWQLNKTFRTQLLSGAQCAVQYNRGKMTAEQVKEELARQGWSDERIEAILNASAKFLGISDLAWLIRNKAWSRDQAIAHLRDQGWDEDLALAQLELERLKRIEPLTQQWVSASVSAYVSKDIEQAEFVKNIEGAHLEPEVEDLTIRVAAMRRELNSKRLSESDAEQAVKRGIWTIVQYNDLLDYLGYSHDDRITKELLLLDAIQDAAAAAAARKKLEDQRAAEKQAKLDAARARQAELEFQKSNQEMSLSDAKRAYVTGVLSLDQYRAYLVRSHIIADDQAVLLELAQQDRDDYVASQNKRAAAEAKLAKKNVSLAELEKAVRRALITFTTFQEDLLAQGFSPEDAQLLVDLLRSDIDTEAAGAATRAAAKIKIEAVGLSLNDVERAVLAGIKTIGYYRDFLVRQGLQPEAVETLVSLLKVKVEDQAAALKKHAAAELALAQKKISLADLERAVRNGIRTIAEYRQRLQAEGFSIDDTTTLVELLQQTIDDAAAAALRKAEIEAQLADRHVSLADVERAVKLGVTSLATYRAALEREKLDPADQQLLVDLLVEDMRQTAAARAKRTAVEAELAKKSISLATFERAVKKGIRTIEEYGQLVLDAGYSREDAALLVELLGLELDELDAARQRKAELDAIGNSREISRGDLERAVRAGLAQVPTYRQWLRDHGYSEQDVELLENLLLLDLENSATA